MAERLPGSQANPLRRVANAAADNLFADAVVFRGQVVDASSSIEIAHGLGRKPGGYLVTRKNAAADLYEDPTHLHPERALKLVNPVAAPVTFDVVIWP